MEKTYFVLDRREGDLFILVGDGNGRAECTADLLPPDAKEGDVFAFENGVFTRDEDETARRRDNASRRLRALFDRKNNTKSEEENA